MTARLTIAQAGYLSEAFLKIICHCTIELKDDSLLLTFSRPLRLELKRERCQKCGERMNDSSCTQVFYI